MLLAAIDVELRAHLAAHLGLGQHALDRLFHNLFRLALEQADKRFFAQTTRETRVAAIDLLLALQTGQPNLLGIDHDYVIAHIDVWGVLRIPLTAQHAGRLGRKTPEGLAGRVYHEPLALNLECAGNVRRHLSISTKLAFKRNLTAQITARYQKLTHDENFLDA